MDEADSPSDREIAAPAIPQLPEVKPFTLGKGSKKAAMPRAEPPEPPEPRPAMPRAEPLGDPAMVSLSRTLNMPPHALLTVPANSTEVARDSIFTSLVRADSDIVGLVAYSIHKQNEQDWLQAFAKVNNRPPDAAEIAAYLIGEGTPRRLATYRHLATATLAGKGPEVPTGVEADAYQPSPGDLAAARNMPSPPASEAAPSRGFAVLAYIGLAVIVIVAIGLAARYGLPGVVGH